MESIIIAAEAAIKSLQGKKTPLLVAIDGRCAAGKTLLASELQNRLGCNVFHMDDFFLPPALRTSQRLAEPGGNVDYERFYKEVIIPVTTGREFSYRPYYCKIQRQTEPVHVTPNYINIAEGSYSCHPALWDSYDLRIFLDVDPDKQLRRIKERNGERQLEIFAQRWIPLEEKYFSELNIKQRCDLSLKT